MRFEQTRDVLNHIGAFHKQAGALYAELKAHCSSSRVRLLLDYIARHELNLEKNIASYRDNLSESLLSSWFKYTHDQDIFAALKEVDREKDMSFDDVLDLALELDGQLVELYQEMMERSTSAEVKDIFNSLLLQEMKEKQTLVRNALGLMDI
ncbi:MAG: hypothetical protein SCI25_12995 [Desulfuromonadales bacterium]|nr:hypothetical protein [Desulfuromonadales bacterium]MDW7757100.1 hypothetical protein [Desulfuromonadales bacterium]